MSHEREARLLAGIDHEGQHDGTLVRETEYGGHTVRVETQYKILVDGKLLQPQLILNSMGQVMTHAMPYEQFSSVIDLICRLIDRFPDEFENIDGTRGLGTSNGAHDGDKS